MTSEIWREVLGVGEGEGWSEQALFIPTGPQQVGDTGHLYFPLNRRQSHQLRSGFPSHVEVVDVTGCKMLWQRCSRKRTDVGQACTINNIITFLQDFFNITITLKDIFKKGTLLNTILLYFNILIFLNSI